MYRYYPVGLVYIFLIYLLHMQRKLCDIIHVLAKLNA